MNNKIRVVTGNNEKIKSLGYIEIFFIDKYKNYKCSISYGMDVLCKENGEFIFIQWVKVPNNLTVI